MLCHSSKLELLCKQAGNCPSLKVIIKMGAEPLTDQELELVDSSGLKLYSMRQVEVSL